jgi:hypothetical protein
MDLEVFGIKLSSFIKAFRKTYDVGNGTYDYMSFLKDTDCASYCAMQQSYENPNAVLNFLITPSLNTIDVVGGKKRKMKGGAQEQYIFILILFLLAVSNVFAGPKHDELVRQFGSDPEKWPKQVTEPSKPQDRFGYSFFLFYVNLGVSPQAQGEYETALNKWNEWKKFEPMQKAYEIEYGEEENIKKSEAETKKTKAETEKTIAETEKTKAETEKIQAQEKLETTRFYNTQLAAKDVVIGEILEKYEKKSNEASFFKNMFYASASILGLIAFFVGKFLDGRRYSGPVIGMVSQASNAAGNVAGLIAEHSANLPRITNSAANNRGGKTKTHRKKRVTRRRRH